MESLGRCFSRLEQTGPPATLLGQVQLAKAAQGASLPPATSMVPAALTSPASAIVERRRPKQELEVEKINEDESDHVTLFCPTVGGSTTKIISPHQAYQVK